MINEIRAMPRAIPMIREWEVGVGLRPGGATVKLSVSSTASTASLSTWNTRSTRELLKSTSCRSWRAALRCNSKSRVDGGRTSGGCHSGSGSQNRTEIRGLK